MKRCWVWMQCIISAMSIIFYFLSFPCIRCLTERPRYCQGTARIQCAKADTRPRYPRNAKVLQVKSENLDEKWKIKIEMKRVTNETTLILLHSVRVHSEWERLCFPFNILSVNIALLCNPIFIPFCEYFSVNIALLCNPSPLLFPPQTQFHQAVPPLQTNIPIDGSSSWRQRQY